MEIKSGGIPTRMLTDDGSIVHFKRIDIGSWNMDTTEAMTVAHGLGSKFLNIISIWVVIKTDDNSFIFPLACYDATFASGILGGGISNVDNTLIALYRTPLGIFETSTLFDGGSNRGYVYIGYTD